MGRKHRADYAGAWHHVMNRGAGRFDVFRTRREGELFERLLGEVVQRFKVEIHAYCLMPNHFHLLVHCPEGGLSAAMKQVSFEFTRTVNAWRSTDGPLFRGRFRSLALETPEYVSTVGRYVHRNPIDVSPPVAIDRYRWSSLRCYVGHAATPDWLTTDRLLGEVAGSGAELLRSVHQGSGPLAVDALLGVIAMLVEERGGDGHLSRRLAIAALDRCDAAFGVDLAERLALPSEQALEAARSNARRLITSDPTLAAILDAAFRLAG